MIGGVRAMRLGVLACLALSESAIADGPEPDFSGRLLVIASDGDMQAQAYAGDTLGIPARDTLSVVTLDSSPRLAGAVAIANSVVGPPASLAVSPDGASRSWSRRAGPGHTNARMPG